MNSSSLQKAIPYAVALLLSLCGGLVFQLVRMPLPWMLGPLFCVGIASICGVKVSAIRGSRQTGQLVIGCGLGLYFTPDVSRHLLNYGGYIVSAAFLAILIGSVGGRVLRRIAHTSATTSFFASVPGGASEMAVLAEHVGARFDQVALCHSIRMLMVISVIPLAVKLSGAAGASSYVALGLALSIPGLLMMLLLGLAGGFLFMKARIPNAWLLGPLLMSLLLTANDINLSGIPPLFSTLAQLLIGCSLGSRLKPSLRAESRRLLLGVMLSGFVTLALSALLGLCMAWLIGESIPTLILATAPGGLAEMCLTAKILRLGVPLVTSFQVMRLAIVVTCSMPVWRFIQFIKAKRAQPR